MFRKTRAYQQQLIVVSDGRLYGLDINVSKELQNFNLDMSYEIVDIT
jgi:hypothetical protein